MSFGRTWVRITDSENIPLREGRAVRVGEREIAIFNLGHRFLAVENRCPHRGGPLSDGIVSGSSVVCPLHAWKVDLEHGTVTRPADASGRCVKAFATRIENGTVLVEVPRAPDNTYIDDKVIALCVGERPGLDREELSAGA